jgi:hypothetical protein
VVGAWCVDRMDFDGFVVRYRLGAAGRAPFDPAVMGGPVALRVRTRDPSSREIERCRQASTDIATTRAMIDTTSDGLSVGISTGNSCRDKLRLNSCRRTCTANHRVGSH